MLKEDVGYGIAIRHFGNKLIHYMAKIDEEQRRCKDSYSQVIQVVYEKHQQPKFQQGTKKNKQKCLVDFVFTKNLQNYGWHIKSYKEKTSL